MKDFSLSGSRVFASFAATVLLAAGLSAAAPASANGNVEPFTLLSEPGSAGLGAVARFEPSPYRAGGTRYAVFPLFLVEGERCLLDAHRSGVNPLDSLHRRPARFAARPPERCPACP